MRFMVVVAIVAWSSLAWSDVPDASLQAVVDRSVKLELADDKSVAGQVLAFDATTVTLAASGTNEVLSLPRAQLRHIVLFEVERHRLWGLQFGLPGTLVVDVDYGRLHAFASPNVLLPVLTAPGQSRWFAGSLGAGFAIPIGGRWKFDAFATVMPLHYTSFYTYFAAGLGAGFHHTSSNGLTVGFEVPVIGFAARFGSSPYGYDAPFRYGDSLGYFYLAGFTTLPLATIGYRFPCHR